MGTEEKLLLAALRQFETHGYAGATTKAIAAEAGVAEVTLFRVFGDKQTLFVRVIAYIGEVFGLMKIPDGRTGDLRQDLLRLCQAVLGHFIAYNPLLRMLSFEAKNCEEVRSALADIRHKAFENVQKLIGFDTVRGDGAQMPARLEWLANSLMGASLSYCLFHAGEDETAYIRLHAGMTANAFLENVTKEEWA